MGKWKSFIVVALLVVVGGAGVLLGLGKFFQARILSDAEHQLTMLKGAVVAQMRVEAFGKIQNLSRESRNAAASAALEKAPPTTNLAEDAIRTTMTPVHDELLPIAEQIRKKLQLGQTQFVSADGRVLAQSPEKEKFGDNIKGLPIISECLAGLYRDGYYEFEGKPFQLIASPLQNDKGKTIGCLLSRDEIGADFLRALAKPFGLELALFLRKSPASSTLDDATLQPLLQQAESDQAWFGKPTKPLPLFADLSDHAFLAMFVTIPSSTDLMRLSVVYPVVDKFAFVNKAYTNVYCGLGILLIFGLLLSWIMSFGSDRQAARLRDEVRLMAGGDKSFILNASVYSGLLREIAAGIGQLTSRGPASVKTDSVSEILAKTHGPSAAEKGSASALSPDKDVALDFDSLLGGSPTPKMAADMPSPSFSQSLSDMNFQAPAAPAPVPSAPLASHPTPSGGPRVELPGELAGIFNQDNDETRELRNFSPPPAPARPRFQGAQPFSTPKPAFSTPLDSPMEIPAPPSLDEPEDEPITSSDYRPQATVIAQVPDELLRAASGEGADINFSIPSSPGLPRSPVASMGTKPAGALPAEESYHKDVFEQFLKTKKQCNESIVGLSLDKFSDKLRKNAADIKARFKCNTVKFQVYVKNGKAALKAIPGK
jgi:hypothetical protein